MQSNVLMTIPAFSRNGGIRIMLEWANRLSARHRVYLHVLNKESGCAWFDLNPEIQIQPAPVDADILIVTSPHGIHYSNQVRAKRTFIFLQMMEHLFYPTNKRWYRTCLETYTSPYPLITISQWGVNALKALGRTGPIHYVGNGVNLDHFPIDDYGPKDGKTVLVEGFVSGNAAKDVASIGPRVAQMLRQRGYKILAYSNLPLSGAFAGVPHEFYCQPDLSCLNRLYARATILLKATQYDFRSCSPVEAMTKGTVCARAITEGDDDLLHEVNCLRSPYADPERLFLNALRLLNDVPLRNRLATACLQHVQTYGWNHWFPIIEGIITA